MEQVSSPSKFRYYEKFIIDAKDVVKPNDIVMSSQLSQHVNLLLQLRNVLGIVS